jgi:predicted SAM-dependent methyltransferase
MDLSMFASDSVEEIVCYHVIEHLGHRNVLRFFQECYRILKERGEFIFECPDLGEAMEQFSKIRHTSGEIKGDWGDGSIYETIYGGQKDNGSFHLNCMTKWQLMILLKNAGWVEPNIIPELPRRGPEYGIKWNIRMRCIK